MSLEFGDFNSPINYPLSERVVMYSPLEGSKSALLLMGQGLLAERRRIAEIPLCGVRFAL